MNVKTRTVLLLCLEGRGPDRCPAKLSAALDYPLAHRPPPSSVSTAPVM